MYVCVYTEAHNRQAVPEEPALTIRNEAYAMFSMMTNEAYSVPITLQGSETYENVQRPAD